MVEWRFTFGGRVDADGNIIMNLAQVDILHKVGNKRLQGGRPKMKKI